MFAVRRLQVEVTKAQQCSIGLFLLRINEGSALLDELRQVLNTPLRTLLQHVVNALSGVVRPASATNVHVAPQLRLHVGFKILA